MQAVGDLMRELDADLLEAGRLEPCLVLASRQRSRDTADKRAAVGPLLRREPVFGDDVADAEASAGLEDTVHLGQDRRLVRREVDHAVRDHDVDRVGRQWDLLDHALEEVHVLDTGLCCVLPRERQHLVGHVQAVGDTARPDALRGEDDVDATARSQVEHHFPLAEVGDRSRIPAAEGCERRAEGELGPLLGVVPRLAE